MGLLENTVALLRPVCLPVVTEQLAELERDGYALAILNRVDPADYGSVVVRPRVMIAFARCDILPNELQRSTAFTNALKSCCEVVMLMVTERSSMCWKNVALVRAGRFRCKARLLTACFAIQGPLAMLRLIVGYTCAGVSFVRRGPRAIVFGARSMLVGCRNTQNRKSHLVYSIAWLAPVCAL